MIVAGLAPGSGQEAFDAGLRLRAAARAAIAGRAARSAAAAFSTDTDRPAAFSARARFPRATIGRSGLAGLSFAGAARAGTPLAGTSVGAWRARITRRGTGSATALAGIGPGGVAGAILPATTATATATGSGRSGRLLVVVAARCGGAERGQRKREGQEVLAVHVCHLVLSIPGLPADTGGHPPRFLPGFLRGAMLV